MGGDELAGGLASLSTATGRSALRAILWGTVIAGTLDICSAITIWTLRGVTAGRVLQSVASGVLGRDAYSGGTATAVLGLLLHYLVMSVIVTLFVLASARLAALKQHAILLGAAYGVVVYCVMTFVVVPLSAATLAPVTVKAVLEGLAVHIPMVGISIALVTRRLAP